MKCNIKGVFVAWMCNDVLAMMEFNIRGASGVRMCNVRCCCRFVPGYPTPHRQVVHHRTFINIPTNNNRFFDPDCLFGNGYKKGGC